MATGPIDRDCCRRRFGFLEGESSWCTSAARSTFGSPAPAGAVVGGAEVAVDPTLVTDLIPAGHEVLACGPEPMLHAVGELCPGAQLAWEAPMACGYGACYGCAVEIDGELKRLCVEGPVLRAAA